MMTKTIAPKVSGHPAAVGDLQQVGRERRRRSTSRNSAAGQQPPPAGGQCQRAAHDVVEQRRRQQHRRRHRGAVGAGEPIGAAETDRQRDRQQHHRPVHERHIDLAVLDIRGLADVHAREPAELHRLPGQRERAGDDRLAGDDRRERRQQRPADRAPSSGRSWKNGLPPRRRLVDQQRGLAGVVQQQRRQHDHDTRRRGSGCARNGPYRRRAPRPR